MADTNEGLSGFGLAFLKVEGGAVHPDDTEADYSDEAYIRQFNAYLKDTGLSKDNTPCSRPELLERIG
jgi:DNA/RNA-binding domain of Phe-tRNA-synthetase-like protein